MTQRTLGKGEFRISSDYLILLAELAFEYGISTQDLLQNSDLSGDFLLRPDLPIGHESALLIIDNYCRRAPKESALAFGRRMTFSKHGALGFAAQYSQSIDDAAETVLRYIATRVQLFDLERQRDNDVRQLFIRNKVPNSAAIEFMTISFLSSVETICRALVLDEFKNTPSCMQIQSEQDFSAQEILPHCRIQSGERHNCLSWPLNALQGISPFFNPALAELAEQNLEKALSDAIGAASAASKVHEILSQALEHMPTIEEVAARLHTSAATLTRRLRSEERSFQQIKDSVRYQHAQRMLLETHQSVDQIADALGYSDASNFTKAFKNWSGVSPSQYRQQNLD